MKHFTDNYLESCALKIENECKKIYNAQAYIVNPNNATDEIEKTFQDMSLEPIRLANRFYTDCSIELNKIKSRVGEYDPKYVEISSIVSMYTCSIFNQLIQYAFNKAPN